MLMSSAGPAPHFRGVTSSTAYFSRETTSSLLEKAICKDS